MFFTLNGYIETSQTDNKTLVTLTPFQGTIWLRILTLWLSLETMGGVSLHMNDSTTGTSHWTDALRPVPRLWIRSAEFGGSGGRR